MSSLPVRALGPADVPRLAALEREVFGTSAWSEAMVAAEVGGPGRWYVGIDAGPGEASGPPGAERADGLVAYAGLWFDGDVAQVMTIGVTGTVRRRGYGRLLLGALLGRARELGAAAVLLEVRVDNEPAISMYRAAGFEVIGRRARYYQPEDVDALVMRLALT